MILESRGTCPHCGQQQILNHAESLTQDQLDKMAEETCTCEAGQEIRFAKKLETTIRNVLGEDCAKYGLDYRLDEPAIDFVRKAARLIHADALDKVQFTEFRGDTIKLTRSRDNVTITRIHKKQAKM